MVKGRCLCVREIRLYLRVLPSFLSWFSISVKCSLYLARGLKRDSESRALTPKPYGFPFTQNN